MVGGFVVGDYTGSREEWQGSGYVHASRASFGDAKSGLQRQARQAQLQLVEENLAFRMRIWEMEALSIMRSSAPEPDAPPNYDELGIVL